MEDSVGLKSDFVRLYNQVDYSLFSLPHTSAAVIGKKGYLFEDYSIQAYLGRDFMGKYYIEQKVDKVRFLQDFLWNEKHILLLVVFAPGKGFYCPEYIPDRYLNQRTGNTNYDYYVEQCSKKGVTFIDFNRWLISLKDTSRYALYSKTGIHWSGYGAFLCADSLLKYLESKMDRPLTHFVVDAVEISKKAKKGEDDIEKTMNLIWGIPSPCFANPRVHFTCDTSRPKPRGLFVGDSYFWVMNYEDVFARSFSKLSFWYYNRTVFPEQNWKPTTTENITYQDSILKQNVIILMQTNAGNGDLGYGWVDRAYDYFYPGQTPEKTLEAQMNNKPDWLASIKKEAEDRGIPVDAMIRINALYLTNQDLKKFRKH